MCLCIIGYAFRTDKNIAVYSLRIVGKCDDVGVVVVLQVFDVDLPQVLVGGKNVGKFKNRFVFLPGNIQQPLHKFFLFGQVEGHVLKVKRHECFGGVVERQIRKVHSV